MHFLKAILIASGLSSIGLATTPSSATSNDQQQPERTLEVRAEPPSGALGVTANLLEVLDNTYQLVSGFVTPKKPCGPNSGVVDGYKYEYTTPSGLCTQNQRNMVAAAVKNFLTTPDKEKIQSTECLTFDHGGYWEGYVKIAKEAEFNPSTYCGPTLCSKNEVCENGEL